MLLVDGMQYEHTLVLQDATSLSYEPYQVVRKDTDIAQEADSAALAEVFLA